MQFGIILIDLEVVLFEHFCNLVFDFLIGQLLVVADIVPLTAFICLWQRLRLQNVHLELLRLFGLVFV